jgi:DNA-binding transcriptional LysR family regulator
VARRLGSATARLYAAPAYLRRHRAPAQPQALAGHLLLDNDRSAASDRWTLSHDADGRSVEASARFRVVANDAALLREVAAAGGGIASLPSFVAAPAVAQKRLVPVLGEWATRRLDVHAVFPSHKSLSPALRAFVDLAVLRLGGRLGAPAPGGATASSP